MTMFELTLRGFNGAVDSTDQMILWVLADMTEVQIKDYLSKEGLYISGGGRFRKRKKSYAKTRRTGVAA